MRKNSRANFGLLVPEVWTANHSNSFAFAAFFPNQRKLKCRLFPAAHQSIGSYTDRRLSHCLRDSGRGSAYESIAGFVSQGLLCSKEPSQRSRTRSLWQCSEAGRAGCLLRLPCSVQSELTELLAFKALDVARPRNCKASGNICRRTLIHAPPAHTVYSPMAHVNL